MEPSRDYGPLVRVMLVALLFGLGLGLLLGVIWRGRHYTADQARWRRTADSTVTAHLKADSLRALQWAADSSHTEQMLQQANTALATALAQLHTLRASIKLAAAVLDTATTLATCREAGQKLAASCEEAGRQADAALTAERAKTSAERGRTADALARAQAAEQELITTRALVTTAPVGQPKWLGLFPKPVVVLGVGCAAALKAGCGLALVAGFPLF